MFPHSVLLCFVKISKYKIDNRPLLPLLYALRVAGGEFPHNEDTSAHLNDFPLAQSDVRGQYYKHLGPLRSLILLRNLFKITIKPSIFSLLIIAKTFC